MSESAMVSLKGGCQCGKKRYHIEGVMVDEAAVCHCRMCQKAMGNIFGVFATFKFDDVSWMNERPDRFVSSSIGFRLFCSSCGTPLAFLPIDEKTIDITLGSLDHPDQLRPTLQTGVENEVSWTRSIFALPSKTTNECRNEVIDVINYQHPDHD